MQITLEEIAAHRPDVLLPPDEEHAADYSCTVAAGREVAADSTVAFVAICRNAMPWLPRTLELVEETARLFRDWSAFVFENDSIDGTKDVLAGWRDNHRRQVVSDDNGRPHLNFTTDTPRTEALAEYRGRCLEHVRSAAPVDYVIVFDCDPWGGWSVDGIAHSLACLRADRTLYGLASVSWSEWGPPLVPAPMRLHYDAFAARLNHWRQRDQQWFHHWLPPVGSPLVEFNSAFGQLAIYRRVDYVAGEYAGYDCEHVLFHRSIRAVTGRRLAINPSMRCVSFWVPEEAKHAR